MLTVKENTTLVGISELRTKADEILKKAKVHRVIIGRRNKPVAALLDIEKFSKMEEMLDALEDIALGYLARERERSSVSSDYVDIEEIEKKLKK